MIPLRLHLHNFLSYRDCTVDFTRLHLAAVSGPNGHGKSALLDGVTWATWGRCRAATDDEAIFLGEAEMLVDFEFEVDGSRFAVNRKKTRGKTAQLQLFQVEADGGRVPITGGVMRETQADINRKLRLDYDTFRNSVFVAQGHADEFTRKTAAERKAVLRNVLGLERYEEYAQRSREFSKERDARLRELRARIGDSLERLERLPAVGERLAELSAQETQVTTDLARAEEALAELRLAASEYERRTRELDEAGEERRRQEERAAEAKQRLGRATAETAAAEAILAGADGVRARHQELARARAGESEMAARQREARAADEAARRAELVIAAATRALETELRATEAEVTACETAAALLPQLEARAADLRESEKQVADLAAKEQTAMASAARLRQDAAGARAGANAARDQAQAIKDREGQLAGVARCPVCRSPLSAGDVEHVQAEYAAERRQLGERYRAALESATTAEEGASAAEQEAGRLRSEREAAERAAREADRALHAELDAAQRRADALPGARERLGSLRAALETEDFEPAARKDLREATALLAAIGYDASSHETLRREIEELAGVEAEMRALESAETRLAGARELAAWAQREADDSAQAMAAADVRIANARAALAAATDVSGPLADAAAARAALAGQSLELARLRGQAEQERNTLLELEATLEEERDRETALADESALYGDLHRAFGRDGVQAMLIDQALPRIEVIANDLLARMTGGRIQLQLATRRERRGGAIAETLDIRIGDELGQRDYEMFSGGEAFRVDFALRIALAQVLAERSGSTLATLIIDEGFGTQDQEGLDRLVDALLSIKDRFRLVLVVTHIEELKARFDRRIEVVKDAVRGSIATVV